MKPQDFIDLIKSGEDQRLSKLLDGINDKQACFRSQIPIPDPTNPVIGCGLTLLQFASYRPLSSGNPAQVLIDHGAEVDLHSACGLGLTDRIAEILAANPSSIDNQVDQYFPLQFAITASRPMAIHCLIDRGDDPNRDLRKVAYFGWEDDVHDQSYTPWKPIHMASLWCFDATRIPVADSLAKGGADLNAISPLDGFRPIHLAAMPNRVDMIRFLVSQGVEVDSRTAPCDGFDLPKDCDGPIVGHACTPLMVAAAEGFVDATACLLELGANPNAENDRGQTAKDFATNRYWNGQAYDDVLELLVARS